MPLRIQIVLLLFFLPTFLLANTKDSLLLSLNTSGNDSIKTSTYIKLCDIYKFENFDSSFYYGQLALNLAQKKMIVPLEARALITIAYAHFQTGKFKKSENYFNQLMNLGESKKDTFYLASAANGLGLVNWKLKRNELAIKYFQDTYQWSKAIKNDLIHGWAIGNLGLINANQDRYEEAISYFNQLYDHAKSRNNQMSIYNSIFNIANCHMNMERFDESEKGFKKALEIILKRNNHYEIANSYYHLAELYRLQGKNTQGINYSNQAIVYCKENGIKDILVDAYNSKSQILFEQKKYHEAIRLSQKGIKLSVEIGYPVPKLYLTSSNSFEKIGNWKKAFVAQKDYTAVNDSLFNLEKENEFAALEVSFQTKQKDIENASLIKDKEAQSSLLKQHSIIIIMISAVLVLLGIVALQLFRARKKSLKMNELLEKEVSKRTIELNQSNTQLKQTNEELTRFAFIASHDLKEPIRNIGGFISLIKRRRNTIDHNTIFEYFDYIEKSNLQMMYLVESIMKYSQLGSPKEKEVKEPTDLNQTIEAIKILLQGIISERKVQINYEHLPIINFYPHIVKIVLKNLIENGIKYNKRNLPQINIYTKNEPDGFYLYVADNGIGIDSEFHEKVFEMFSRLHRRDEYRGAGMGLAFCRKIVRKYNGEIKIESSSEAGTTFVLKLDVNVQHKELVNI